MKFADHCMDELASSSEFYDSRFSFDLCKLYSLKCLVHSIIFFGLYATAVFNFNTFCSYILKVFAENLVTDSEKSPAGL